MRCGAIDPRVQHDRSNKEDYDFVEACDLHQLKNWTVKKKFTCVSMSNKRTYLPSNKRDAPVIKPFFLKNILDFFFEQENGH